MKHFSSDNNSGVHPDIMHALQTANTGNTGSYGDDPYTREAEALFRATFGPETRTYFVFLGTAANVLGLHAMLKPHEGVICAASAHIHTDEGGAAEAVGRKLYTVPHTDGKIRPEDCAGMLRFHHGVHNVAPRVVSISQSTEYGTLYSLEELRGLSAFCREHGLYLHMDGARIANAAAALDVDLRTATRDAGVDMLSFGGTKNGLMFGEAVVIFNPDLAVDFEFYRKRNMQLGSKMRFISAQFGAYLTHGLWRANAAQANATARLLADRMRAMPGLHITRPVEVNAVFARLPHKAVHTLAQQYTLAVWDDTPDPRVAVDGPELRIMTSFNTTAAEIEALADAIARALTV